MNAISRTLGLFTEAVFYGFSFALGWVAAMVMLSVVLV
jgi:hypothetical protein